MANEPMTPEGHDKLRDELKRYKSVERPQNVRDIEEARAHGDLRENAEFHAAKERQSHIAAQIEYLEDLMVRAQVIDPKTLKSEKVVFGAKIKLLDINNDEKNLYQIVGKPEADLKAGKISYDAPLSKLLMGKMEGDTVQYQTPKGLREYEILKIYFE